MSPPASNSKSTHKEENNKKEAPKKSHELGAEKAAAKDQGHQACDVEGEENAWKFRDPYKLHEEGTQTENGEEGNNGGRKVWYEGKCHCEKVRYQVYREKPLDSKFCHCGTCQVLHGAPFQHAAILHKNDLTFTSGHHNLTWYDPSERTTRHKLPCKVSCSYCGSRIMDEGRNMVLLFPELIQWGGEKREAEGEKEREERKEKEKRMWGAKCHMFYEKRVVDIKDGLPKWRGMKGESELGWDSPPDLIRKRKREMEEEEEGGRGRG